jgi:small subunit ribosomal protein S4
VCRLCRREGIKLFLKGERCFSPKCAVERRSYAPGQHGQGRQRKVSQYGIQLREKQKLRRIYGVSESQFRRYFRRASKEVGVTGEAFLRLLERRLDNVVYRLGMAGSRAAARQLVAHGHIHVNGRKVDIPSYLVRPGETVGVEAKMRENPFIVEAMQNARVRQTPAWLELDPDNYAGRVVGLPSRADIDQHLEARVDEKLIVEFYSR